MVLIGRVSFSSLRHFKSNIGLAPITHVRNRNNNIQWRSPNVVESDFPYNKELLLKERICSLWEQILSFNTSSHFEKGHN